jgi:hypothetical protein
VTGAVGKYVESSTLRSFLNTIATDGPTRERFIHDFINLWEIRSQRLMKALGSRDFEDADVVCLSIRSSSTMLGAWTLEAIAGMVHTAVKQEDLPGCMSHLARLHEVGQHTCRELLTYVETQSSSEAASR